MHWFDRLATKRTTSTASGVSRRGFLGSLAAVGAGAAAAAVLPGGEAAAAVCASPNIVCGPVCINPLRDPDNCGTCGNACSPSETCAKGLCCPCGYTNCSGTCVDTWTSPGNCGTCGHACPPGYLCKSGRCILPADVTCASNADCGVTTACATYTCMSGVCHGAFAPVNTVIANQPVGNCEVDVCDGHGDIVAMVNNANVPPGNPPCQVGTCVNGTPSITDASYGTPCPTGVCDGNGNCVCRSNADCPTNPCTTYVCSGGECVVQGYALPETTCPGGVCDGSGHCVQCLSTADCPTPGVCETVVCNAETCVTTDLADGTSCPGGTCDGNGNCVP